MNEIFTSKYVAGLFTPFLAWGFSLTMVNQVLQTGTLLVGFAVGVITLLTAIRKWKKS